MKPRFGTSIAIALLGALSCGVARAAELPTSTPAAEGLSAQKLEQVGKVMHDLIEKRHIAGGIVVIARHGKIVFHEPYGLMDLEEERPVQRDTIFRIYSMSKALTSAAALILLDEGKLDLQAPVSKYLPEFADLQVIDDGKRRPAERVISVKDLFLHTSGITYGAAGGNETEKLFEALDVLDMQSSLEVMTTKLSQIPLAFDPGEDWVYGASIDVLGRVVEVASGLPLDKFLQQRLLTPLGMTDTAFFVPAEKQPRFAVNYYWGEKGKLILRDAPDRSRYLSKPELLSGGGGLVGTASDYMRFLLMVQASGQWQGKRILSAEAVELMTTNQLPESAGWVAVGEDDRPCAGFGLGFSVVVEPGDARPHARKNEYGWGGAASTHYWTSPEDDLIVVTMEQRMPYSPETEELLKPIIYEAIEE